MVEDYLINGNCKRACGEYDGLIKDITRYLQNNPKIETTDKKKLKLYKIHAMRQQAEMLRITGKYNDAFKLFGDAYKKYNYFRAGRKIKSVKDYLDKLKKAFR